MPTPLSSTTLRTFSLDSGIPTESLFIADDAYWITTRSWIERRFAGAWDGFVQPLLTSWQAEYSDCDNYAGLCTAFARDILHPRTVRGLVASGRMTQNPPYPTLAVGEFWYCIGADPKMGHAIVRWVLREGSQWVNCFFEPQPPGRIVRLTKREIESCTFNQM